MDLYKSHFWAINCINYFPKTKKAQIIRRLKNESFSGFDFLRFFCSVTFFYAYVLPNETVYVIISQN